MSFQSQLNFSQQDKNFNMQVAERKIERKWVNQNAISKHLYCTICQEVFDDPKRITCGHTFCNGCITQWRQKSDCCPMCRNKFSATEIYKDLIASNIINDLEVFCIHKGCPWKKQLLDLKEHLSVCFFDSNKMPSYIKSYANLDNIKEKEDGEEVVNSDNYLNFNSNIGLKARLYQRNKELVEKVYGENSIKKVEKRDSILELLTK